MQWGQKISFRHNICMEILITTSFFMPTVYNVQKYEQNLALKYHSQTRNPIQVMDELSSWLLYLFSS